MELEAREMVCAACGRPLVAGDEVALCPGCGRPCHSACQVGDDMAPYAATQPTAAHDTSGAVCAVCGGVLGTVAGGVPIAEPAPAKADTPEPAALPFDFERFVDKRLYYYRPRFTQMNRSSKMVSWNWAAFLFSPYWLVYRKLYAPVIACWVSVQFSSLLDTTGWGSIGMGFASAVVFGLFGNRLYFWNLERVSRVEQTMEEPARSRFVRRHTGTSSLLVLGFVAVEVLLRALLYWLLG